VDSIKNAILVVGATVAAMAGVTAACAMDHGSRVPARYLKAEGTLVGAPTDGVDLTVSALVEPGVMSIAFTDEKTAWDFYHEAVANGEKVCLSDLGLQPPQFNKQRYWLRSC
jgi:hypothetical protein